MKQKYKCHRTCDLEGKLDMYLHDNPSPTTMKECKCCGGDIKIRNPKGYCDHLYYPEYCSGKCQPSEECICHCHHGPEPLPCYEMQHNMLNCKHCQPSKEKERITKPGRCTCTYHYYGNLTGIENDPDCPIDGILAQQSEEKECKMPDCELVKIKHYHNHPNCTYNSKPSSVSSKWEKEFELYYPGFCGNKTGKSDLKRWIKFLLQQRDKELIGKIEKMRKDLEFTMVDQVSKRVIDFRHGYNEALDDVIKLVKGGGV